MAHVHRRWRRAHLSSHSHHPTSPLHVKPCRHPVPPWPVSWSIPSSIACLTPGVVVLGRLVLSTPSLHRLAHGCINCPPSWRIPPLDGCCHLVLSQAILCCLKPSCSMMRNPVLSRLHPLLYLRFARGYVPPLLLLLWVAASIASITGRGACSCSLLFSLRSPVWSSAESPLETESGVVPTCTLMHSNTL